MQFIDALPLGAVQNLALWEAIVLGFMTIPAFSYPISTLNTVCRPSNWKDLAVFLGANYFAHAASVPTPAGAKWFHAIRWVLLATFLPFAGLGRSISLISRYVTCGYGQDHLRQAFASNAVVVMARSNDWEPRRHEQCFLLPDIINLETLSTRKPATITLGYPDEAITTADYSIHGLVEQPEGYRLVSPTLGDLNYIISYELEPMRNLELGRSRNWVKSIIAIIQLVCSSITIYQTRGDQIDRYGYAAFGLSVFSYTLMSFANLRRQSITCTAT